MKIEHKTFQGFIKATDPAQGIIEAIVSVYGNVDDGGDVVKAGAFDASLARKLPKGVWMHDWEQPVAKTLVAKSLAPGDPMLPERLSLLGGLYVKSQFNLDTQRGREAFSDIQFGIIDEFSIGYMPTKVMFSDQDGTRELVECDLFEWSPVLVGMNRETALLSAKSGEGDGASDTLPFSRDLEAASDTAKRIAERVKARVELLKKQGRMLSQSNIDKLKELITLLDEIDTVQGVLQELVDQATGTESDDEEAPDGDEETAGKGMTPKYDFKLEIAELELFYAGQPSRR